MMNSFWLDGRLEIGLGSSKRFVSADGGRPGSGIAAFFLLVLMLAGVACSSQNSKPSEGGSTETVASQPAAASTSAERANRSTQNSRGTSSVRGLYGEPIGWEDWSCPHVAGPLRA